MEYRRLGNSGLKVSPLCLGTMEFGAGASERAAGRIISMARDAGVNFIDTAAIAKYLERDARKATTNGNN